MNVEYGIYLIEDNDLVEISEKELAGNLEDYRPRLLETQIIEGALLIGPRDKPGIELMDELWVLVQGLCFRAVCVLMNDPESDYVYRYMSADETFTLSPQWPKLRLSGTSAPALSVDAGELLQALFDCGERYLALLEALGGREARMHDYLAPFAQEAKTCLARMDGRLEAYR